MKNASRLSVSRAIRAAMEPLEPRTLLSAGAPDPSFGGTGLVDTGLETTISADFSPGAAVFPADGKLVVASLADVSVGGSFPNATRLVRFNTDGSLDKSFGVNGVEQYVLRDGPTTVSVDGIRHLRLQADGKILVVGGGNHVGSSTGSGMLLL